MLLNIATLVWAVLCSSPVLAQTSTTTSAPAATYTIDVGADGLNYSPRIYNDVPVGSVIEYRFYPLNHSVARASYGEPCIPYEDSVLGGVGFWSGFQPIDLVTNDPPIFHVTINDTEPVFFYCSAPGACFDGMIGVINPNSTQTFDGQFAYSQNATVEFSPGQYFPVESVAATITRSTTATGGTVIPTPTSLSATTTPASTANSSSSKSGIGTGPIIGISIGAVAILVLAGSLIYMCGRQKTVTEMLNRHSMGPSNHNSYIPSESGISEAYYRNMPKTPASVTSDGRFSGYRNAGAATETDRTESYRSTTPPIDERTSMMGHMRQGIVSPGSPGYPSPGYFEHHEMGSAQTSSGMSAYLPTPSSTQNQTRFTPIPLDEGPHELAVPSRNPSAAAGTSTGTRPFSYTDSEADFTAAPRRHEEHEKSEEDY